MIPIIITLSLLIPSQLGRKNSGTDLGTGYGGLVCGDWFTYPIQLRKSVILPRALTLGTTKKEVFQLKIMEKSCKKNSKLH